jgi:hypothetical protein
MKRHDWFWKNHAKIEAFFDSEEQMLHTEALSLMETLWQTFTLSILALMTIFSFYIGIAFPEHFWVAIFFLTFLCVMFLTFYASGLLSPKFVVVTTKAVYYCRGKNCDFIFEIRYSNIEKAILLQRTAILVSVKTYNRIVTPRRFPGSAPWAGQWNFLANRLRILTGKPTRSRKYDFTELCDLLRDSWPRHYRVQLDLKNTSEIPQHIKTSICHLSHIQLIDKSPICKPEA